MYTAALQNPIRYTNLMELTAECPLRPPSETAVDPRCTSDRWGPHHGDSSVFHCGFDGFLEDREPTPENPTAECFYDKTGRLVDENHRYAGCVGSPNSYSGKNSRWDHTFHDPGGINSDAGWEGWWTSGEYDGDRDARICRSTAMDIVCSR